MQTPKKAPKKYIKGDPDAIAKLLKTHSVFADKVEAVEVERKPEGTLIKYRHMGQYRMMVFRHKQKDTELYAGIHCFAIYEKPDFVDLEVVNTLNENVLVGKVYLDNDNDLLAEIFIDMSYRIRERHLVAILEQWHAFNINLQLSLSVGVDDDDDD